jgi:hypothetical protein
MRFREFVMELSVNCSSQIWSNVDSQCEVANQM